MASLVFDRGVNCDKITYSNNVKLFQQCPSVKAKNVEMEATSSEVQAFVEEPVLFNFGNDYGNKLFLDSKEEVMWSNFNALVYVRQSPKLRYDNVEPSWKNSSDDHDVYKFSSVEDIIHYFLKHN